MSEKIDLFDLINNLSDKSGGKFIPAEINISYDAYIINKAMSFKKDCIFAANEINKYPNLTKSMQYDFYYHFLPKKKRYDKWHKKAKDDEQFISLIMDYYKYSRRHAEAVLPIMHGHFEYLKSELDKGGVK